MKNIKNWRLKILIPCFSTIAVATIAVPAIVCSIPSKVVTTENYASNNEISMGSDGVGDFSNMLMLKNEIDPAKNYIYIYKIEVEAASVEEPGVKLPRHFDVNLTEGCSISSDNKTLLFHLKTTKPADSYKNYRISLRFFINCKDEAGKIVWSQTVKKIRFKLKWS